MRHVRRRRRFAALLYAAFGLLVAAIAAASASVPLALVAIVAFALSVVALDRYPVERQW